MSQQLGQRAGYEAIENGSPIQPLLSAAIAVRTTAHGAALLGGLLEVISNVFDACQRQGIRFAMTDTAQGIAGARPHARRLLITAMCQHVDQNAADVLGELVGAIYAIRDGLSLSAPATVESPEPPLMRVEIVGMPERTTKQTVNRRDNGDLVGSSSIERDS